MFTQSTVGQREALIGIDIFVSDYATKEKNDRYQEYAAYTSAAVLKHIIINCLSYE